MANPKSRIEGELDGTAYTDKSRIEEYIAYIKGDSQTKPDKPRSRIEAQLDEISPGGGGGGTLVEKTITENDVYFATDDDADGYSKVTVNVPQPVVTANRISADLDNYVEGATSLGNGFNIKNYYSSGSLESSTITIDETIYHGLKFNNAPGATVYMNRGLDTAMTTLEIETIITELTTSGDCRLVSTGGTYYNASVWYTGGVYGYDYDKYLKVVVSQGIVLDSNLIDLGGGNTYDSSFLKTDLVNSPLNIKYTLTPGGVVLKINNVDKVLYSTSIFNEDMASYGINIGANGATGTNMLLTKAEYTGELMTWDNRSWIPID